MQYLGLRVYLMACATFMYSLRAHYRASHDEARGTDNQSDLK
jgi:hypothetical protein